MAGRKSFFYYWMVITVVLLTTDTAYGEDSSSAHKAKVRHARQHSHYSDNVNNEIFTEYESSAVRSEANNNHKPIFFNCTQYEPHIKEEQPTGVFVEQVRAADRDPLDRGGNITYSIVTAGNDASKFMIDPITGVITTKRMFDRDEPAREKEIYVTVRATDNGKPQLDDICRFRVIIEDVNDNTPTFDKGEYRESIPADLPPGSEVMRISASDIDDGDNRLIEYALTGSAATFFKVDPKTGVVRLDRPITDKSPGFEFKFMGSASDKSPTDPKTGFVNIFISVVDSFQKPPVFEQTPPSVVHLLENFTDSSKDIATFVAKSNTDEDALRFRLVSGKSKDTFRLLSTGTRATIRLSGGVKLDYEEITEYHLTVRVENRYNLAAEYSFTVQIEDVNDMFPVFSKEINSGLVLENEKPGTTVMQVSAVDLDQTEAFRKITYSLEDNTDKFDIDPISGKITTKVKFDRETNQVYNIKVVASDGAPSAYDGLPNVASEVFKIDIGDKNDNEPTFTQKEYSADILENADSIANVAAVKATDPDSASHITYSIQDSDRDMPFTIDSNTGEIKIARDRHLDYEKIKQYTISVKADDGIYSDYCKVHITVQNVNDNAPVFDQFQRNLTIVEEDMKDECLTTVRTHDPDKNPDEPQNIKYNIVKDDQQKFLTISDDGCLRMLKPLDRDPPNGADTWQVYIQASDEGGLTTTIEVWITLEDVNDNAPFLRMSHDVIWRENQGPGNITMLEADDYDTPKNGKPFTFRIPSNASDAITKKFRIEGSSLNALTTFDREEQKEYRIPIEISDSGSPTMTGTSYLTLIIGDDNDNPMKAGSSSIFVYFLDGHQTDTQIGRVYVDDPDDWDLPDKMFYFLDREIHPFDLDSKTGMLTVNGKAQEGVHELQFRVTESSSTFETHEVKATVTVTIKLIPEEAVDKSGSIRFEDVTAEEFVTRKDGQDNKADILKQQLAVALNNSLDNIDVFTVMRSPIVPSTSRLLDVRFSAHGSPYYSPERINSAIVRHQDEIEDALGLKMYMVNVDECLQERVNCKTSCWNELFKMDEPAAVYTNTSSFIGVQAYMRPKCECRKREIVCLNGGTPTSDGKCACDLGFDGPNCEQTSIGFRGTGWALYPMFEVCEEVRIMMWIRSTVTDALIFYAGPDSINPSSLGVQDFISLELRRGNLVLLVDYGTGTAKIEHYHQQVADNNVHKVEIILKKDNMELKVDNCALNNCQNLSPTIGENHFLNVNGPLQIGGTHMDLGEVMSRRNWTHKPVAPVHAFSGCVSNFTVNGHLYNLGRPSLAHNEDPSCSAVMPAEFYFGFDWSFYIAILICFAILTILLLAVAVHRRKVEDMYKDTDDIRENIINYEDEGGGEGDTAYDMRFLRLQDDDNGPVKCPIIPLNDMDEVPDICGFLDGKKHSVDNDPETLPFDDVRHYAYEGDGNTTGSLSSLASGTDEGDLNFDYLSNFGPRFRKLADMYGEDASDEDSDTYHHATSESWC